MHPSTKLNKDENGKDVDDTRYRGMIGSLLYLTASRPDIIFSAGLCSRFQSQPKVSHECSEENHSLHPRYYKLWVIVSQI